MAPWISWNSVPAMASKYGQSHVTPRVDAYRKRKTRQLTQIRMPVLRSDHRYCLAYIASRDTVQYCWYASSNTSGVFPAALEVLLPTFIFNTEKLLIFRVLVVAKDSCPMHMYSLLMSWTVDVRLQRLHGIKD